MDPNIGYAGFRIGMFMVVGAGLLVLFTDSGTPGHVISQISLICGLLFLGVIVVIVKLEQRK
jgi:hypothetical protein